MTKEELVSNLNDCYNLRSELEKRNVPVPNELSDAIVGYERDYSRIVSQGFDYHKTVRKNSRESLEEYVPETKDEIMHLQVGDACAQFAAIIKSGRKYGIFELRGAVPTYYEPTYWSDRNPFIYDKISFAGNFSLKNNFGVVLVKKDGLWGAIDVTMGYQKQILIPIVHPDYRDIAPLVERLTGFPAPEWNAFEKMN